MCVIIASITFVIGILIGLGINTSDELKYKKVNVAGTYKTSTWNGKEAVIALKSDKTCMYPNNSDKCAWSLSDDKISIILSKEVNENCNIKIFMKNNITTEERVTLSAELKKIEEIEQIAVYDPENMWMVTTKDCSQIDKVYNEIGALDNIKHLDKHNGGMVTENTEHIATLIDGGLMLEGYFFEKVK